MVCGIFQVHAAQIVSCKFAPLRSPFCEHNMALLCVCVLVLLLQDIKAHKSAAQSAAQSWLSYKGCYP